MAYHSKLHRVLDPTIVSDRRDLEEAHDEKTDKYSVFPVLEWVNNRFPGGPDHDHYCRWRLAV